MREELELKIDKLILELDNDSRIKKIIELKNRLCNDQDIISKIDKLNTLDKYSSDYKDIKKELFNNKDFVLFKELENEINFLILEINSRLKTLTNERVCKHESN